MIWSVGDSGDAVPSFILLLILASFRHPPQPAFLPLCGYGELKPLCSPVLWPPMLGGARDAVPLPGTIEPLCMWPLLATSRRRRPLDRS